MDELRATDLFLMLSVDTTGISYTAQGLGTVQAIAGHSLVKYSIRNWPRVSVRPNNRLAPFNCRDTRDLSNSRLMTVARHPADESTPTELDLNARKRHVGIYKLPFLIVDSGANVG